MIALCTYAGCSAAGTLTVDGWQVCARHAHVLTTLAREETAPPRLPLRIREEQVASLWARGLNDKQISEEIYLNRSDVGRIRRSLGLPPRVRVAQCGTRSGYVRHTSRKEKACGPCAEAQRRYDTPYKRLNRRTAA